MTKQCSKCNIDNPTEAKFCRHCGNLLSDTTLPDSRGDVEKAIRHLEECYKAEQATHTNTIAKYKQEVVTLHTDLDRYKSANSLPNINDDNKVRKFPDFQNRKCWIYGNIIVFLLLICGSVYKCQKANNRISDLNYALSKQEDFKTSVTEYKPFEILNIELKSNNSEFGDTLYEDNVKNIIPRITVAGLKMGTYKLKTKYYKISNRDYSEILYCLKETSFSSEGFSNEEDVSIGENQIEKITLSSFGKNDVEFWNRGWYCVEFWYNDICYGKKEFAIVECQDLYYRGKRSHAYGHSPKLSKINNNEEW